MKKFIYKSTLFSLIALFILTSVNFFGDSAKIFHPNYEKKIAEIIFNNKNATNISNYDERILQKELIQKLKCNPDILILGSSRTMLINSTFFANKKVINNSVSGASLEDLIGIYQLYKNKNILPKKIILGIDPWIFNKNHGQTRWKSLEKEYNLFFNKNTKAIQKVSNTNFDQLISLSYFQASLQNIPNVLNGKSNPIGTKEKDNETTTKLIDASLSYGKKYRETTNDEVYNNAKIYIAGGIYSIENFNIISPKILQEFKKFVSTILNEKIELYFFLAPYHPIVYKKIQVDYEIVLDVENEVINYGKKNNVTILGSFNPLKIKINQNDFYDGMHSKEQAIRKIMNIDHNHSIHKPLTSW